MPISNNTNALAGHEIGTSSQTSGITKQLEVERSRANYQYRIQISEQKAMKLRQYAYKMVYRWTINEKLQMIQSYGELDLVKNKNDEEEINRQLVETLLVNLSEGELNAIVQQVNYTERELMNNINRLNNHHSAELEAAMRFRAGGMPVAARMQSAGGDEKGQKAQFEPLKNGFAINSILRKELNEIFKTYSKAQLAILANEMGIVFDDGDGPAIVKDKIITELGYYVAMMTGKSKGMMNITAGVVDGAKKVLRMTSFAWTVGETPVTARERAHLLTKAKEAKAIADARNKMLGAKTKKISKNKAIYIKELYSGANADPKKKIRYENLTKLSYDELLNRAAEMGILVTEKMNTDQIIAQILKKEEGAMKQQNKLLKQYKKRLSKGDLQGASDITAKAQALKKYIGTPNAGSNMGLVGTPKGLAAGSGTAGGVPTIKIDENGNILSEFIDMAVPVIIVGQTKAGFNEKAREVNETNSRIKSANDDPVVRMLLAKNPKLSLDDALREAQNTKSDKKNKKKFAQEMAKYLKDNKLDISDLPKFAEIAPANTALSAIGVGSAIANKSEFSKWYERGKDEDGNDINDSKIDKRLIDVSAPEAKTRKSKADIGPGSYTSIWGKDPSGILRLFANEEDRKNNKQLDDSQYFNTASQGLGFVNIRRQPAMPVWIVNGFTEYLNEHVESGFEKVVSANSAIYTYLSSSLPVLFAGLQQAGTAFNLEGPAATAAAVMDNVMGAMDVVFAKMKSDNLKGLVEMYATGGTGKATKPSVSLSPSNSYSQFMTGDSTDGKENPEMVSVDWNNRQFAVKPVKPTVEGSTKLTDNERLTAFGVSFREGTVRYRNDISGDTDDDIALKVYPVTPGINDKVEVNGQEVSMIELMAGMYGSVMSIQGLLGQSVELTRAIAAKPVAVQSSSDSGSSVGESFPTNLDGILRGE